MSSKQGVFFCLVTLAWSVALYADKNLIDQTEDSPRNGTVTLSARQTDYETGKMITQYNLENTEMGPAILIGMDFSNRLYRKMEDFRAHSKTSEPIDYSRIRDELNRKLSDMYTKLQTLKSTDNYPTTGFDRANLFLKILAGGLKDFDVPGANSGQAVGELVLEEMKRSHKMYAGGLAQSQTQDLLHEKRKQFAEIYKEAYEITKKDPHFRVEIYEKVIAPYTKALPWASYKENMERDRGFAQGEQLKDVTRVQRQILDNVGPDGKLRVNIRKVYEEVKEVQDSLREDIEQNSKAIVKYFSEADSKKTEQANQQLKYDFARSSFSLLSNFAELAGDSRAAQVISTTGTAAIEIASSIDKFRTSLDLSNLSGKELMSCVNLAAGIGNAVKMILSIFGGKSTEQMILEQIQKLSEQIQRLQKNMNDRFDHVDRSINRMFMAMADGFQQINSKLDGLEIDIKEINGAIASLQAGMVRMDAAIYSYLKVGFNMPVAENLAICLKPGEEFGLWEFEDCLARFKTFAIQHASNVLSTGALEAVIGDRERHMLNEPLFYGKLGDELSKGVWNNINVIGNVIDKKFGDKSMRATGRDLVNAIEWAKYVNHYITFVASHANYVVYAPDQVTTTTNEILSAGDDIKLALRNLGFQFQRGENAKEKTNSLQSALGDYESILKDLESALKYSRELFESSVIKKYKLNKKAAEQEQRYLLKLSELRPCPGYRIPKSDGPEPQTPVLHPPIGDMGKSGIIPNPILMAADLGLGNISICYDKLLWMERAAREVSAAETKYGGVIGISVRFTYTDITDHKDRVFSRRVVGGGERFEYETISWFTKTVPYSAAGGGVTLYRAERIPGASQWAHGDLHPPNGYGSWLEYAIPRAWNSGDLASKLVTGSTEALDGKTRAETVAFVEDILNKHLEEKRKQFNDQIRSELDSDKVGVIERETKALTGARQLVESLVFLTFPKSLSGNDDLRSLFYGNEPIIDGLEMRLAYRRGMPLDPERTDYYSKNAKAVEKLKRLVSNLLATSKSGGEPHQIIESAQQALETLKAIQGGLVPSISISQAIREMKDEVEKYISSNR